MVSLVEKSRYHYETLPVLFLTASKVGMSSLRIRIQKSAPSGTIVLDNAKTRNALSRETIEDLTEAFADFHREKSVRRHPDRYGLNVLFGDRLEAME